jgi:hypothetical protein
MSDRNLKQRIVIKFLVKLGKNGAETLEMLRKVYSDKNHESVTCVRMAQKVQRGTGRCPRRRDDERTSTTDDNAEEIREIVLQDRRMSIRLIAEQLKIDKETVRIILQRLGMRKVCERMVPCVLTDDQKQKRVEVCNVNLEKKKF